MRQRRNVTRPSGLNKNTRNLHAGYSQEVKLCLAVNYNSKKAQLIVRFQFDLIFIHFYESPEITLGKKSD